MTAKLTAKVEEELPTWTAAEAEALAEKLSAALLALSEAGRTSGAQPIAGRYGAVFVRKLAGSHDWLMVERATSATPNVSYSIVKGVVSDPMTVVNPGGTVERRVYLEELVHLCSAEDLKGAIMREAERLVTVTEKSAEKARAARDEARTLMDA